MPKEIKTTIISGKDIPNFMTKILNIHSEENAYWSEKQRLTSEYLKAVNINDHEREIEYGKRLAKLREDYEKDMGPLAFFSTGKRCELVPYSEPLLEVFRKHPLMFEDPTEFDSLESCLITYREFPGSQHEDELDIYPSSMIELRQILSGRIKSGGSFYSLGCGDGRELLIAHELGAEKIIGIDINPRTCQIAKHMIKLYEDHFNKETGIEIRQADLFKEDLSEADTVFMSLSRLYEQRYEMAKTLKKIKKGSTVISVSWSLPPMNGSQNFELEDAKHVYLWHSESPGTATVYFQERK